MDWKAFKKDCALAILGILFLILYISAPSFAIAPVLILLVRPLLGVAAGALLLGSLVAMGVILLRYFKVVDRAIKREEQPVRKEKQTTPKKETARKEASKQKTATKKSAREDTTESELSLQMQHRNRLLEAWASEDLLLPVSELLRYFDEVSKGGHAQYLANDAEDEESERAIQALIEYLPSPLRENLERALAATHEEFDDLAVETILAECDSTFHENEQLFHELIQLEADRLATSIQEKAKN